MASSPTPTPNLNPLTNGSYWGPDESAALKEFEDLYFIGFYVIAVMSTAQFILYCICMNILLTRLRRSPSRRLRQCLIILFTTALTLSNLIVFVVSCYNLKVAYIDNRNFPGGVVAYITETAGDVNNVLGITALVVGNILADLLLMWRCYDLLNASRKVGTPAYIVYLAMVVPVTLILASLTFGILFDVFSASPGGFLPTEVQRIGLAYFSLSLALNLVLTGMIMTQMYIYQRFTSQKLGWDSKESSRGRGGINDTYQFVSNMFVESAAVYTLVSIPVLVSFALGSNWNQIFLSISPPMQLICSYFIIWRVADGRAVSKKDFTAIDAGQASTMRFGHNPGMATTTGITTTTGEIDMSEFPTAAHHHHHHLRPPTSSPPHLIKLSTTSNEKSGLIKDDGPLTGRTEDESVSMSFEVHTP